jgi:hypothetical protein
MIESHWYMHCTVAATWDALACHSIWGGVILLIPSTTTVFWMLVTALYMPGGLDPYMAQAKISIKRHGGAMPWYKF